MAKTILCYGDSLTWGYDARDGSRYPFDQRWPGILQTEWGARVRVVEEGLCGRTVFAESWVLPDRSGQALLPPLLESHAPLDAVVLMLGTNDCSPSLGLTAERIALGCLSLIWAVQKSMTGPAGGSPQVLLIAPPLIAPGEPFMDLNFRGGGGETCRALPGAYATVAAKSAVAFLDASEVVTTSAVDGVHLDPPEARTLARAVKAILEPLLFPPIANERP